MATSEIVSPKRIVVAARRQNDAVIAVSNADLKVQNLYYILTSVLKFYQLDYCQLFIIKKASKQEFLRTSHKYKYNLIKIIYKE